ncbi:MAG: lysoplasmalogenase [Sneathiella sp.]|nr:lysoplasmalogenase [Sneathiella sp.]
MIQSNGARAALAISLLAAFSYLLLPFPVGSISIIIQKSLACFSLAILVTLVAPAGHTKKTLILALLASTAGDAFLAIRTGDFFIHGLGSFLIAHLLYIRIFAKNISGAAASSQNLRHTGSALIIGFAIIMMYLLWDNLGGMKAPVFIYITVISIMGVTAILSNFSLLWAGLGAISFMVSDAAIAVNKFLSPFDWSGPFIWITYMLAQYALVYAILSSEPQKKAAI